MSDSKGKMKKTTEFNQERPAEDQILDFVRYMIMAFEGLTERGSEEVKQGASYYLKAYRTVEGFILAMKKRR